MATIEEMRERIIDDDAEWLIQCAIKGRTEEVYNYVANHVVNSLTQEALEIEYSERWPDDES